MYDWRADTSDPNNREAARRMDLFLRSVTRVEETSRREMIIDFARDKALLDIGAAGHTQKEILGGWEHGLLAKVAKKAVAADISRENCEYYNAKGFDFRFVDATSDADLGERFDRVFMGDVIEHVNDPVALLAFAKRHLRSDGRILITTPNPFAPRVRHKRGVRATRYVMANLEHTRWISASTMHELAHRAGLEITGLRWPLLKKPRKGFAGQVSMFAKRALLAVAPLESVFAEYAFELAIPAETASRASD